MSRRTLFISTATIKERTGLHGNVDEKLVNPIIKLCQDKHIKTAIGSDLFDRLQAGIVADDLNGNETTLLDDYITDCLCWYVLSELPVHIVFQFYNKGVVKKTDEGANIPDANEILNIENRNKHNAEYYREEIIKYLKQHDTDFPEYLNQGTDIDDVQPLSSGYTCPINLDMDDEEPKSFEEKYQGRRGIV